MNRLKDLRTQKKLLQKDVAEFMNVAKSTYCCWETGKNEPDFTTAGKLADFFGVPIDYLLGNSSNPESANDNVLSVFYKKGLTHAEAMEIIDLISALNKKQLLAIIDLLK